MNRYRLAAHFASRSCDGFVKRFGLSSPTLLASLLVLLLLFFLMHQYIDDIHTLSRIALFFLHATVPSRGGSKANQRGSRSLGIFQNERRHEDACFIRVFHGVEEEDEGDDNRIEYFIEFRSSLLFIDM